MLPGQENVVRRGLGRCCSLPFRVPGEPDGQESCPECWGGQGRVWEPTGAYAVMAKTEHWDSDSFWRCDFDAPVNMRSLFNLFL